MYFRRLHWQLEPSPVIVKTNNLLCFHRYGCSRNGTYTVCYHCPFFCSAPLQVEEQGSLGVWSVLFPPVCSVTCSGLDLGETCLGQSSVWQVHPTHKYTVLGTSQPVYPWLQRVGPKGTRTIPNRGTTNFLFCVSACLLNICCSKKSGVFYNSVLVCFWVDDTCSTSLHLLSSSICDGPLRLPGWWSFCILFSLLMSHDYVFNVLSCLIWLVPNGILPSHRLSWPMIELLALGMGAANLSLGFVFSPHFFVGGILLQVRVYKFKLGWLYEDSTFAASLTLAKGWTSYWQGESVKYSAQVNLSHPI